MKPSLLLIIATSMLLSSCSITRRVERGEYLLRSNVVVADEHTPKRYRVVASDVQKYIRQSPNKRLLGLNFYLWAYNVANPDKKNGWNNFFRRIGEPPIILDTAMVQRSVQNIDNYVASRGYLNCHTTYKIDSTQKRAKVIYTISQGTPFRLGKITAEFQDASLKHVIGTDTAMWLLRTGDVMDINVMNKERQRIVARLRDMGYYNFTASNIYYIADTLQKPYTADVKMVVKRFQVGVTPTGEPIYENNSIYRLRNIYINNNYNPVAAANDSLYFRGLDTTQYRGLNIIYRKRPAIREKIIRGAIPIYPNHIYNASQVQRTYDNIMGLGYFRSSTINFSPVAVDSTNINQVSYVGDAKARSEATTERYLDVYVLNTPSMRQSYKVEFEASTTSSFWSLSTTVGYQNRNIFRGVELFDISIKGGYEFMRTQGKKSSFELGGTTSFSFPRFLLPFRIGRTNKALNTKTKIELSINSLRRPYYHRTLSTASWGYSWSKGMRHNFTFRPIDISLIKMGFVDQAFLESLKNPYLAQSYQPQLIAGLSAGYLYATRNNIGATKGFVVRTNIETSGNFIYGLSNLFAAKKQGQESFKILGIKYSQYLRGDVSVSDRIPLGEKLDLAYRFFAGAGMTYGNAKGDPLPFDRLYYVGGSNSMRGWQPRTLGPGSESKADDALYPSKVGNLRLEANVEARFPIWGFFNGALFCDVGNVWVMGNNNQNPTQAMFKFNRFYKQLGFDSGVGARLDFGFFIFRFDWGLKIHDPSLPQGERWIKDFKISNTTLSFGVGYPF